jgi:hypothetical protein
MTYGVMVTLALPIEAYDALHAQVQATQGGRSAPGLLVHFARPTPDGCQVVEVWRSRKDSDQFNEQVVNPIVERFAAGQPAPPAEPVVEEFEVHGLTTSVLDPAAGQPATPG